MSKLVVGLFERLATIPLGSLLCHAIQGNVLTEVFAQNSELDLFVLMEHTSILRPDETRFEWRKAPHWHEFEPNTVHAVLPSGQLAGTGQLTQAPTGSPTFGLYIPDGHRNSPWTHGRRSSSTRGSIFAAIAVDGGWCNHDEDVTEEPPPATQRS